MKLWKSPCSRRSVMRSLLALPVTYLPWWWMRSGALRYLMFTILSTPTCWPSPGPDSYVLMAVGLGSLNLTCTGTCRGFVVKLPAEFRLAKILQNRGKMIHHLAKFVKCIGGTEVPIISVLLCHPSENSIQKVPSDMAAHVRTGSPRRLGRLLDLNPVSQSGIATSEPLLLPCL